MKEKPDDTKYIKDYLKIIPEAPGVWEKDLTQGGGVQSF